QVQNGELEIVLAGDEPAALPVHVITPQGRLSVPKVRAFLDFACPGCEVISRGWPRTAAIAAPPFVRNAEECRSPDAYSRTSRLNLVVRQWSRGGCQQQQELNPCLHPPKAKPS